MSAISTIKPPRGWAIVNDACIGVPDGAGYLYTVYHVGERPNWRWEACRGGEVLAMDIASMDEAVELCRADYREARKAA